MNCNNKLMLELGWNDRFAEAASRFPELYVGRVTTQHRDQYTVLGEGGELAAEVSGKFRFETQGAADFPAVGDFVMLDRSSDEGHVASVVDAAETLEVVGVVQAVEDSTILQSGIYYTPALTRHVIEKAAGSEIVAAVNS